MHTSARPGEQALSGPGVAHGPLGPFETLSYSTLASITKRAEPTERPTLSLIELLRTRSLERSSNRSSQSLA